MEEELESLSDRIESKIDELSESIESNRPSPAIGRIFRAWMDDLIGVKESIDEIIDPKERA